MALSTTPYISTHAFKRTRHWRTRVGYTWVGLRETEPPTLGEWKTPRQAMKSLHRIIHFNAIPKGVSFSIETKSGALFSLNDAYELLYGCRPLATGRNGKFSYPHLRG